MVFAPLPFWTKIMAGEDFWQKPVSGLSMISFSCHQFFAGKRF